MTLAGLREGLAQQLDTDIQHLRTFDLYYRGKQPLRFLSDDARKMSENRLFNVVANWPRLVVDAVEERLDVEGFRTEAGNADDLWRIWQANSMDERSQQAHLDALVYGRSFVWVWVDGNLQPRISVESPLNVTVEYDPATGEVIAALKRWINSQGYGRALLFTPEKVAQFRTKDRTAQVGGLNPIDAVGIAMGAPSAAWEQYLVEDNPLGRVPFVPFVNRPRLMLPLGESEIADVMPLADACNKTLTDLMVASEFTAMPRRWATGLTSNTANPRQQGEAATQVQDFWEAGRKSKVWVATAEQAKFGQFPEAQLENYIGAIRMLTTQVAAIAGLPPHYLGLVADNAASADAIRSAEASLVKKAYRKQRAWGERWEDVMRLAVQVRDGVAPTNLDGLETIWRSPETRTIAQAADAATKLYQAGIIDRRTALEEMAYSPETIDRLTGDPMGVIA